MHHQDQTAQATGPEISGHLPRVKREQRAALNATIGLPFLMSAEVQRQETFIPTHKHGKLSLPDPPRHCGQSAGGVVGLDETRALFLQSESGVGEAVGWSGGLARTGVCQGLIMWVSVSRCTSNIWVLANADDGAGFWRSHSCELVAHGRCRRGRTRRALSCGHAVREPYRGALSSTRFPLEHDGFSYLPPWCRRRA